MNPVHMTLVLRKPLTILGVAACLVSSAPGALYTLPVAESSEHAALTDEDAWQRALLEAAYATTNVAELNDIYGTQNFPIGASIELRFSPVQERVGLLGIDSREDLLAVIALGTAQPPIINLIFVDSVDWCGFFSPSIVGCSNSRGNTIVLESDAAASLMGTELLAHELGHLLDLRHVDGAPNLMNPSLNGDTSLTPDQIATINDSRFVQGLDPDRFIRVNLTVVVPESSAAACLLLSVFLLTNRRRRCHRTSGMPGLN